MLSKTGFTHSDLLSLQIDYAGGSLNVNGTIMRDVYKCININSYFPMCGNTRLDVRVEMPQGSVWHVKQRVLAKQWNVS